MTRHAPNDVRSETFQAGYCRYGTPRLQAGFRRNRAEQLFVRRDLDCRGHATWHAGDLASPSALVKDCFSPLPPSAPSVPYLDGASGPIVTAFVREPRIRSSGCPSVHANRVS
jgi:hypothetical protein